MPLTIVGLAHPCVDREDSVLRTCCIRRLMPLTIVGLAHPCVDREDSVPDFVAHALGDFVVVGAGGASVKFDFNFAVAEIHRATRAVVLDLEPDETLAGRLAIAYAPERRRLWPKAVHVVPVERHRHVCARRSHGSPVVPTGV